MTKAITAALMCFLASGCITTIEGDIYTAKQWSDTNAKLGRMVIVPPRGLKGPEADEVTRLAREAVDALPGVEIVPADSFLAELGQPGPSAPISDHEVVLAARKLDLDSICLLNLGGYGVRFGFSWIAPIIWKSETVVVYDLRILDVDTGKLLLEAVRKRATGGFFAIRTMKHLPAELSEELADVLSTRGEAGAQEASLLAAKEQGSPAISQ